MTLDLCEVGSTNQSEAHAKSPPKPDWFKLRLPSLASPTPPLPATSGRVRVNTPQTFPSLFQSASETSHTRSACEASPPPLSQWRTTTATRSAQRRATVQGDALSTPLPHLLRAAAPTTTASSPTGFPSSSPAPSPSAAWPRGSGASAANTMKTIIR